MTRQSLVALLGLGLVVGCTQTPVVPPTPEPAPVIARLAPADYETIAKHLEKTHSLGEAVDVTWDSRKRCRAVSLEEKLANLGAHMAEGKLVGRDGREIFIWTPPPASGTPVGPEHYEPYYRQLKEWKQKGTVIEIHYWPGRERGERPPLVCRAPSAYSLQVLRTV
jgi:hypothetical protein